jgi:hypothetical protein
MHPVRASVMPSRRLAIVPERLESCVRRLEPADRALLDLSLNRGIADAAMAPILKTDATRLAWTRARAIERVASRMGMNDPSGVGEVRAALMDLPSRAWMPLELQPAKSPPALAPPEPVNAEIVVRTTSVERHHVGQGARPPIFGRASASALGGLSERAKRAYPRGALRTNARRAAGALAIAATAALAFRRR